MYKKRENFSPAALFWTSIFVLTSKTLYFFSPAAQKHQKCWILGPPQAKNFGGILRRRRKKSGFYPPLVISIFVTRGGKTQRSLLDLFFRTFFRTFRTFLSWKNRTFFRTFFQSRTFFRTFFHISFFSSKVTETSLRVLPTLHWNKVVEIWTAMKKRYKVYSNSIVSNHIYSEWDEYTISSQVSVFNKYNYITSLVTAGNTISTNAMNDVSYVG